MANSISNAKEITNKIQQIISSISEEKTEKMIEEIISAHKIFVFGVGRSGLVAQAFAMRLVHLGKTVHFVGEVTTPAISSKDLIIVISGSGTTSSVHNVTEAAKKQGAKIVFLTSKINSPVAELSNIVIEIPLVQENKETDNYFARQLVSKTPEITPMGTLFELTVMIFFDSVIPIIMERMGVSEKNMKEKHSNLE